MLINLHENELLRTGKPLGNKAYGSIGHLPGSRLGPGDHKITGGQAKILLEKPRDKHDIIIVTEKLDGSCVSVANIDGNLVALTRAGYIASTSRHLQHQYFDWWVRQNMLKFSFLKPGMRVVGEWLAQAHGARYYVDTPFIAFDLFVDNERCTYDIFTALCLSHGIAVAHCLNHHKSISIEEIERRLGEHGHHGCMEKAEGAVWRVERQGKVDFLGKYVRSDKVDGKYFKDENGNDQEIWNWRPHDTRLCA